MQDSEESVVTRAIVPKSELELYIDHSKLEFFNSIAKSLLTSLSF